MHQARRLWVGVLLVASVALGGCSAASAAATMPSGEWVGRVQLSAGTRFIALTIDADASDGQGKLAIWGADGPVTAQIEVDDDAELTLRFRVADSDEVIQGRWEEDRIVGIRSATSHAAELLRVIALSPNDFQAYRGGYASGRGDHWFVGSSDLAGRYYLAEGEKQMGLFPVGPDRFYATTGETVTFVRDDAGAIRGLVRADPAGGQVTARRADHYVVHPFHVENGAVSLAGELLVPMGSGPFPAVVFSQGSGPETRERRRLLAEQFARNGIAAAIYDKRGTGDSLGSWVTAGFDDLANDALAVVSFVAGRPDITADAVGLWGLSQGGWVVPLAASRSSQVAFAITVSAAGMSPNGQELYRWRHALLDLGYAGPTLDAALKAVRLQQDLNAADLPVVDDLFLGLDFGYDPVPTLRNVKQPILAIWGGEDRVVPPRTSAATFRKVLHAEQHPDTTLRIYEGAGHSLGYTPTVDGWVSMPPAYVDAMVDWILDRTVPQPELRRANAEGSSIDLLDVSDEVLPVPALPWYGRALPQLGAIGMLALTCLVVGLGWPVQSVARAVRGRGPAIPTAMWPVRLMISLVGLLALFLLVGLLIALGRFLMSDEAALLRYSTDPVIRALTWVVPPGAFLAGLISWRVGTRRPGLRHSIAIGAVLIGVSLLLILLFRYWELLRL